MRRSQDRDGRQTPPPPPRVLQDLGPVGMELGHKERTLCCNYEEVGRALKVISSRGF